MTTAVRTAVRPWSAVSALGWAAAATALVLGALGWWLGWVELTVTAATLASALAVSVLLTLGRSTYAVELELSDHRVTVGRRAIGRLEVRNTARGRLLPARLELPVGRAVAELALPSLGPGRVHEEVFAIPTTRRAVVVVGPVRSVRGDPLGLLRRRVRWTDPVDLYVHPELVSLGGASSGLLRDLEGQATRVVSDSDMSFHALRDYVAGDDRRHIHWRTTARTGQLVVRQFEDTRRTHTAIALATTTADYADADEFELAVAVVASLGVQALRDQRELTVLAGAGSLRTDSPPLLLDDCARLELADDGTATARLGGRVAREAADATVAVLVTGSVPTAPDLRTHARRVPVGVRTVVLRCATGADVEVATNGGLSVARLGSLADLPRVLRRVVGS
ncbi:hypothetical protein N866_13925 [Actinotalea ferrariae CF5-4]|uniref:DUF58 domain-containing protein n=1 Tax=Actinotalea ferrariae CF5-4 TaxID=948458 RepID=A0A021VYT7_9CELL|nr:DUF58 domain-containing protein [Actinotalea ferrariae]EYR64242.1 hypothetical protein N866_13925 [Actinotalea ferrariae CF5-4]